MLSRLRNKETFRTFNSVRFNSIDFKLKDSVTQGKYQQNTKDIKFRSDILCEILNCNVHTAREIIAKNKCISEFNLNYFYQNAKFINDHLRLSDLIEFPSLLTLQPCLLQHRYFSLKELGFCNVTPNYILKFSCILKQTPAALKQKGLSLNCKCKSDILTKYLNASERDEVNYKLQKMYEDGSDLQKIREVMNAEFLAAKLECSLGKAHEILHKHAALRVQSILNTDRILDMLLYKLGFSYSKIYSSLSLLSAYHETVESFLSEFSEIFGVEILFLVKRLPLLLKQDIHTMYEIESVLKKHEITKDQLISCPKVLLISPKTLDKRLSTICNTEDLAVLKSNKKFLWLVYYYSNLNPRLNSLKALDMPCSISMFTVTNKTFKDHLFYSKTRPCLTEVYVYLADIFKMSEKEIFERLHHCTHLQNDDKKFSTSTLNCQKVIEFLLISGVTKEQIFRGLEIVFYNYDVVKDSFKGLEMHPLCQPYTEWVSHRNLIQLLIYIIELNKNGSYHCDSDEQENLVLKNSNYG